MLLGFNVLVYSICVFPKRLRSFSIEPKFDKELFTIQFLGNGVVAIGARHKLEGITD